MLAARFTSGMWSAGVCVSNHLRFLRGVRGGDEAALEGGDVDGSQIEQFADVTLVEDLVLLGEVVEAHVGRVRVRTNPLLVQLWLPLLEIVASSRQVKVFLSSRSDAVGRELRGLNQPSCVPGRQAGHAVERPQFEMRIEVSDVDLGRAALLGGTVAGGLGHRITFLEPVAHANSRVVAVADLVHEIENDIRNIIIRWNVLSYGLITKYIFKRRACF